MNKEHYISKLKSEIRWLEEKLKTVKKEKHRKDLQRQIKEREYNLHLGDFSKKDKIKKMEIVWVEFKEDSNDLPAERKMCMVCFEPGNEVLGQGNGVCTGYLRYYSKGPFWVTHGVSRGAITHYADCLPEDFAQNIPTMNFPKKNFNY